MGLLASSPKISITILLLLFFMRITILFSNQRRKLALFKSQKGKTEGRAAPVVLP